MTKVSAKIAVAAPVSEAETLWFDASRWAAFVDGFGTLEQVDERWPHVGTRAVWASNPGGRGRVVETVERYEPRVACTTAVEDDTLEGHQTVAFAAIDGGTAVTLTLEYAIKARNAFTPVVDLLFVRRAERESLLRTLRHFALEVRAGAAPSG